MSTEERLPPLFILMAIPITRGEHAHARSPQQFVHLRCPSRALRMKVKSAIDFATYLPCFCSTYRSRCGGWAGPWRRCRTSRTPCWASGSPSTTSSPPSTPRRREGSSSHATTTPSSNPVRTCERSLGHIFFIMVGCGVFCLLYSVFSLFCSDIRLTNS